MICYNQGIKNAVRAARTANGLSVMRYANMTSIPPLKHCPKCGNEYPATIEYFHRSVKSSDGLRSCCKQCRKSESRLYYDKNKERLDTRNEQWRKNNPDKMREYQRRYVSKNPERVDQSKQQYYKNNADRLYEKIKRRRKSEPDKYNARKAVQIAVASGKIQPISECFCSQCGKQAQHYHHWSYNVDHWLDVTPLCAKCHMKTHKSENG